MRIGAAAVLAATLAASAWAELKSLPSGWELIGIGRSGYEAGVDLELVRAGKPAGLLRARHGSVTMPGVLAQTLDAQDYRGKRLSYAADLKFRDVRRQVGIWMWVLDGRGNVLSQDFMDDRILKGDSDWRTCRVVLDVPKSAATIVYGLRLWGPGQAWISGVKLETVGREVAVTESWRLGGLLPLEPVNLF